MHTPEIHPALRTSSWMQAKWSWPDTISTCSCDMSLSESRRPGAGTTLRASICSLGARQTDQTCGEQRRASIRCCGVLISLSHLPEPERAPAAASGWAESAEAG